MAILGCCGKPGHQAQATYRDCMSYLLVKLEDATKPGGIGTVVAIVDTFPSGGEMAVVTAPDIAVWANDAVVQIVPGDRVFQGVQAVMKLESL